MALSYALYPLQDKPRVQSGTFSCSVPFLRQAEGTKWHFLMLCTHFKTSRGYRVACSHVCTHFKANRGYRVTCSHALCPFQDKRSAQTSNLSLLCTSLKNTYIYFTNFPFSNPRQACAVPLPPVLWPGSGCRGCPVLRQPSHSSGYRPEIRSPLPSIHSAVTATGRSLVPA